MLEWRSREAELTSLAVTTLLARHAGARIVIAHVSHPEAASLVQRERDLGAFLSAETCPQYLVLREDEVLEHGALRKFTPPARARSQADLDAMWARLADGTLTHVSTDHAPATLEQKRQGSIWDVHFGLPGLDTTLPVLLDAAHRGKLTYERVAGVYSETPARTYRLYPRKGALELGSDADLVLVDPGAEWVVKDGDVLSKAGWSPFSGRRLVGRPVGTYLRGQLIAKDGEVVAEPGTGHYLPGPGQRGKSLGVAPPPRAGR